MTSDTVTLRPVGQVVGGRSEMVEDDWHDVRAVIRLDDESFTASAVLGLPVASPPRAGRIRPRRLRGDIDGVRAGEFSAGVPGG